MYESIKQFIQSKTFHGILMGFAIALFLLFIFQAGMFLGYRKAAFSYRFGDNYYRAFDGGRHDDTKPFRVLFSGGFMDRHGTAGEVVSMDLPTFVVAGPDEVEKVVFVGDDTQVRRFNEIVAPADIALGDFAVIFGSPNESSQIEARLIRLLPPPPTPDEFNVIAN